MGGHAVIDALLNTQTGIDLQMLASQALHGQPVLQPDYRITVEYKDGKSTDLTPVFAGRRGQPVGFAARWQSALLALEGDEGARAILRQHAALLHTLASDDPGVLQDVDTPADLAALGPG